MSGKVKIVIGLLLIAFGVCYLYFGVYNKPPRDITNVKPEVEISSDKLLTLFHADESLANATYVQKTIEVQGVVKEITTLNNRYSVLLQSKNDSSHVICDMAPSKVMDIKKLKPGQTVRLKGICKGFLMDVIMLNCILVNDKTNE